MKAHESLKEVIVTSQQEMDEIPADYKGQIHIEATAVVVVSKKYHFRVKAWENSSVVARENSSVVARGNSQIVDRQVNGKILLNGNARTVFMPKNIHEFMDFYGIKHTKTRGTFYKAVRKSANGEYVSSHSRTFTYTVGETAKNDCDQDARRDCSFGLHISHLGWALDFGRGWDRLAILEVESKISDIVTPTATDGKVRTSELKVIREVPLEECGVYGRILAKRKKV